MKYKISEIFYSIQGEGFFTGTPATFIRFYGCNLDCHFCDEPLHKIVNNAHTLEDLKKAINPNCKHIVITGGEPSIYNLNFLIDELKKEGYFIQVETNGFKIDNIKNADYITISPKNEIIEDSRINEYKFVLFNGLDIDKVIELSKNNKVYLQPLADGNEINKKSTEKVVEIILNNSTLKLSLQTHKYLRIQ